MPIQLTIFIHISRLEGFIKNINSVYSGNKIPGDLSFLCFLLLTASFIIIFLQKVKNMYVFNISQKKGFK